MATIKLQQALDRLEAIARGEGVTLEDYLDRLVDQVVHSEGPGARLSGEELDRLLDAESAGNSLYGGTYSRADIYRDHD